MYLACSRVSVNHWFPSSFPWPQFLYLQFEWRNTLTCALQFQNQWRHMWQLKPLLVQGHEILKVTPWTDWLPSSGCGHDLPSQNDGRITMSRHRILWGVGEGEGSNPYWDAKGELGRHCWAVYQWAVPAPSPNPSSRRNWDYKVAKSILHTEQRGKIPVLFHSEKKKKVLRNYLTMVLSK